MESTVTADSYLIQEKMEDMKDSNVNSENNRKQHGLKFMNVVRVFPDNLDFTISEIRRQHEEVRLTDFALSLSFHPTGTPASRNTPPIRARDT